jgi:hypothetical protein
MTNIIKIKDIYLCTGLHEDNNGNKRAYDFLSNNNIPFTHLAYWDPSQHNDLFNNLKTWHDAGYPDINEFPFVYYTAFDNNYNIRKVFLIGGDSIINSDIVALSKL